MKRYYLINKPFGMLSQFTREAPHHQCLQDLDFDFSRDVYPVGRLDRDSEGLLLLSNDKRLNQALLNPRHAHEREYWVQVEKEPRPEALERLRGGVEIKNHRTAPCQVRHMSAPKLPPRDPPVRFRKEIPTAWIALTLREGKNRQVRRMTAAVGHPTLRLWRWRIEHLTTEHLAPGEVRALSPQEEKDLMLKLKL